MAEVKARVTIDPKCVIIIPENELEALHELMKYGDETLVKIIEEHVSPALAKHYHDPLTSFFKTVRSQSGAVLEQINDARKVADGKARIQK
jgi:hypothetical protein